MKTTPTTGGDTPKTALTAEQALRELLECKAHDIRRKAPENEHGRWFSITVPGETLERARAALAKESIRAALSASQPLSGQQSQEAFSVKHYSSSERPIIKGNGFDG